MDSREEVEGWPLEKEEKCVLCHATFTVKRKGDGRAWRGSRNFWYTSKHKCAEMRKAQEVSARMNQFFNGGRK